MKVKVKVKVMVMVLSSQMRSPENLVKIGQAEASEKGTILVSKVIPGTVGWVGG